MKKLTCLSYFLLIIFCVGFYEKSLGMNAAFPVVVSSDFRPQEICQTNIAKTPEEEIDPRVEKFVKGQLSRCGFKDQKSLCMIKSNNWAVGFAYDGRPYDRRPVVFIARHDLLKHCLKEKYSFRNYVLEKLFLKNYLQRKLVFQRNDGKTLSRSVDEYLKQEAAVVQHEGGHLMDNLPALWNDYNDPTREVCTYGSACGALLSPFAFLCKSKKIALPLFGAMVIAPSYLGQKLIYRYMQYREFRADDNVQDNIHLLRALKQHLKDHLFIDHAYFRENPKDTTHPHPRIRIRRIKERIRKIKEKGDPKAFEDPLTVKEDAEMK